MWVRDRVSDDRYRFYLSTEEADSESSAFVHKILLSEPVLLGDTIGEALGVLNVGSDSDGSALYKFASNDPRVATEMEEWSQRQAAELAISILKHFTD